MTCKNRFGEENMIRERYELALERVHDMMEEESVQAPFLGFFRAAAAWMIRLDRASENVAAGMLSTCSEEELAAQNRALYEDVIGDAYLTSYANPTYAKKMLGEEYGLMLCVFYAELRGLIGAAYDLRMEYLTIYLELLIEIYNQFEGGEATEKDIHNTLYWFYSDYSELFVADRMKEQLAPGEGCADGAFLIRTLEELDPTDLRFLYRSGEYVSDDDRAMARYLGTLPEEELASICSTVAGGLFRAYEVQGLDILKKKTVKIRFRLGLERIAAGVLPLFREKGIEPVFYRTAASLINRRPGARVGYFGTAANPQYDYDHRFDEGLFLNRRFKERKLEVLRATYEEYKEQAAVSGGVILIETFGEEAFEPVKNPDAAQFTKEQIEIVQGFMRESMLLSDRYSPSDENSFSIIAFPSPGIGPDFEEIFHETIRVNTLDVEKYGVIQQKLIDALDTAECVHITGRDGNETDLTVALCDLTDPAKQTRFENCLADCNIPLGEVFTSPKLTGTNGLLHVKHFFLDGLEFRELRLTFENGKIASYSCENYEKEEENRALIEENILKYHETLPLGEFAIGTNTTAYAMGRRFDIGRKLPILIEEKTGPHFAVGDTCYSFAEDHPVFNPDGKEIIARDNEISILRKTEPEKAYFSCHTDITIPYDELDCITVKKGEGDLDLIRGGRFVLAGTEALNDALDQ